MFGILWGVISVVILSATGEGFQPRQRQGADGARQEHRASSGAAAPACRPAASAPAVGVLLTVDDVRALPDAVEHDRGRQRRDFSAAACSVKSAYNAAAITVDGIEPQYQDIRTIDVDRGRNVQRHRRERRRAASRSSAGILTDAAVRAARTASARRYRLNGIPHTVIGRIRQEGSGQRLQRPRQRQGLRPVHGDGARLPASRRAERRRLDDHRRAERRRRRAAAVDSRQPHRRASRTSTGRSSARSGASSRGSTGFDPGGSRCRPRVGHVARDA